MKTNSILIYTHRHPSYTNTYILFYLAIASWVMGHAGHES